MHVRSVEEKIRIKGPRSQVKVAKGVFVGFINAHGYYEDLHMERNFHSRTIGGHVANVKRISDLRLE